MTPSHTRITPSGTSIVPVLRFPTRRLSYTSSLTWVMIPLSRLRNLTTLTGLGSVLRVWTLRRAALLAQLFPSIRTLLGGKLVERLLVLGLVLRDIRPSMCSSVCNASGRTPAARPFSFHSHCKELNRNLFPRCYSLALSHLFFQVDHIRGQCKP